jgi:hypothetical protein
MVNKLCGYYNGDAFCGICHPGEQRCAQSSKGPVTEFCDNTGNWATNDECYSKNLGCFLIDEKPRCAVCSPGDLQCSPTNNTSQFCSDDGNYNFWKENENCSDAGYYCLDGSCQKGTDLCAQSSTAVGCADDWTPWSCFKGDVVVSSQCPFGEACWQGTCSNAL